MNTSRRSHVEESVSSLPLADLANSVRPKTPPGLVSATRDSRNPTTPTSATPFVAATHSIHSEDEHDLDTCAGRNGSVNIDPHYKRELRNSLDLSRLSQPEITVEVESGEAKRNEDTDGESEMDVGGYGRRGGRVPLPAPGSRGVDLSAYGSAPSKSLSLTFLPLTSLKKKKLQGTYPWPLHPKI